MKPALTEKISEFLSLRRLTIAIFFATCVIYAFSPRSKPIDGDMFQGAEISRVGMNLARDGNFANPFYWIPTGPTAHTAPVYVGLYAFVATLFGPGQQGAAVLWALNVGFLALQIALLPAISEELGLGLAPGIVAAILAVVIEPYRVTGEWEALLDGALVVVLLLLTLKSFKSAEVPWRFVPLGFLWGAAILTNPECVLLMVLWAYLAAKDNRREVAIRARRLAPLVFAGAALVCLPWIIRNYRQLHGVFFVRDNFGLELYTSNNPCAGPTAFGNLMSGCHWLSHPYGNRSITQRAVDQGEVRFNQEMLRRAVSWIRSNPRAFAWLTARRFFDFWFPDLGGLRYSIPMGILTVLALPGIVLMRRRSRLGSWLFAATLAIYPLVHYIIQVEDRYRYAILWATLLPAAYILTKWTERLRTADVDSVVPVEREPETAIV